MKTSVYILIVILFSSCWTYQDSQTGMPKKVSVIDLAKGASIAITDPFPEGKQMEYDSNNLNKKEEKYLEKDRLKNVKSFKGWWIYGEGQHIFKDESTLEEWNLDFPDENMQELVELYLSISEMEYFPMECIMKGTLKDQKLIVIDFEILYIQGCGE